VLNASSAADAAAVGALLPTVRAQLDVDEARSLEVERLLQLVMTTFGKVKEDTGETSRA
jgi:hypothetical protein